MNYEIGNKAQKEAVCKVCSTFGIPKEQLCKMQQEIEIKKYIEGMQHRFMIIARKD